MHHNQFLDVIVKKSDYDVKRLIMMQKLVPRTVGLKLTRIGHVDRITLSNVTCPVIEPKACHKHDVVFNQYANFPILVKILSQLMNP